MDPWNKYDQWNEKLADHFFSYDSSQRPVYLDMETELLEGLCLEIHGDDNEADQQFTQVIARTIKPTHPENPFQSHLNRLAEWNSQGQLEDPPCIALLSFFSSVAEEMVSDDKFEGNDYYGRLASKLGVHDANLISKLKKGFESSLVFWENLNKWLESWDGDRGLPTAKKFDRRKYVSVAISQALVRNADRKILKKMFLESRLSPRRRESYSQMELILNDWLLNSRNTNTALSKLWKRITNKEIKNRVIEIACQELLHWDGSHGIGRGSGLHLEQSQQNLLVRAKLETKPIHMLELFLITYGEREIINGDYDIASGTDETARTAFSNCDQIIMEEMLDEENAFTLEPWNDISPGLLLQGTLSLEKKSSNRSKATLERKPNILIILTHDQLKNEYNEVGQIQLLTKNIILCREEISEEVSQHLLICAHPSYTKLAPNQLKGLPDRWHAYIDVKIFKKFESKSLEVLTPPSSSGHLTLSGGLRLNQSTWSNNFPPTIEFADSEVDEFCISLQSNYLFDSSAEKVDWSSEQFSKGCSFSLKDQRLVLPDGNYKIEVISSNKAKDHCFFTLRSGNYPRPTARIKTLFLGFELNQTNSLNPISPDIISENSQEKIIESTHFLVGGWAHHTTPRPIASNVDDPDIPLELPELNPVESEEDRHSSRLNSTSYVGDHCLVLGYHHWICEPHLQGISKSKLKSMECKHCKSKVRGSLAPYKITSNRTSLRSRRIQTNSQKNTHQRETTSRCPDLTLLPPLEPISDSNNPDMDGLLDSISYLGGGSWEQFVQLSGHLEVDALYPYKTARILSSLGHCEFRLDQNKMRPVDFRIAFPTIVQTSLNCWVLSGSRSTNLLEAISNRCEKIGVEFTTKKVIGKPTVFHLKALENQIEEIIKGLYSDIHQKVLYSCDFSLKSIALSQPILKLAANATNISVSDRYLERYDIYQNRWSATERFSGPGAYRIKSFGKIYLFANENNFSQGTASILEPRIVKHLEARRVNRSLISYNQAVNCLTVAPNCELPSLLDRAATMCSGECPSEVNGSYIYQGVSKVVAEGIWSKLIN